MFVCTCVSFTHNAITQSSWKALSCAVKAYLPTTCSAEAAPRVQSVDGGNPSFFTLCCIGWFYGLTRERERNPTSLFCLLNYWFSNSSSRDFINYRALFWRRQCCTEGGCWGPCWKEAGRRLKQLDLLIARQTVVRWSLIGQTANFEPWVNQWPWATDLIVSLD